MVATMVVLMSITDPSWMPAYFAAVPALLAEHGARVISAGRQVTVIEGDRSVPDRMAVFEFPDMESLTGFMADERYAAFRTAREAGARSEILIMVNEIDANTQFA